MLVLGYYMKNSAVAKGGYVCESSYLLHDSTSAKQTQGAWTTKTISHRLLSLEKSSEVSIELCLTIWWTVNTLDRHQLSNK